jgi:hypothetical protein
MSKIIAKIKGFFSAIYWKIAGLFGKTRPVVAPEDTGE